MTDKITLELTLDELKELDKNLYYCEETWSIFDKIKVAFPQPQMNLQQEGDYVSVSYNDTTYYRLMGETTYTWYIKVTQPVPNLVMVDDAETERLLDGLYYNHIVVKRETAQERGERLHNEMEETIRIHDGYGIVDYKPTSQTPEQVADGLKEAFREAVKQGVVSSSTKPQTLTDLIYDWWERVFGDTDDTETCIDDLVDRIEAFLPKPQSAAGSQNAYVESAVEGFNDAIKQIKSKLR